MEIESPLRILICHNTYQQKGGEDTVVDAEYQLLHAHGHEVKKYIVSNDDIKGFASKISAAFSLNYSIESKNNLAAVLDKFRPDIVHFHNTFPLLTASVYDACIERHIPVVQTLHNYRFICPTALLMLHGKPCENSLRKSAYWAVRYKVYRQSFIGTFFLARMIEYHKKAGTWQKKVNRYIALTAFAKDKFVQAGFPASKVAIKPNFTSTDLLPLPDKEQATFALFVGRVSEEKGIRTLLEAFNGMDIPLKIAGNGPLLHELSKVSCSHVEWLGEQTPSQISLLLRHAQFIIVPSLCYETFGMVMIEAFSQSLPVLCSNIGSMQEIVEDGVSGKHFVAGDVEDLQLKVRELFQSPSLCAQLGEAARYTYEQRYTPAANYEQLIKIYQEAMADNA